MLGRRPTNDILKCPALASVVSNVDAGPVQLTDARVVKCNLSAFGSAGIGLSWCLLRLKAEISCNEVFADVAASVSADSVYRLTFC